MYTLGVCIVWSFLQNAIAIFLQYMLRLPRDATVEILKKAVSELTGVHHRDVRAVILSLFQLVAALHYNINETILI